MAHNQSSHPLAATHEPAIPSTPAPFQTASTSATLLPDSLLSDALVCGQDARPGWTQRVDGWTPERIHIFLHALAQCGVVADAARHAGMSKQSAYAFRNSPKGRPFDVAWRTAQQVSRGMLADELQSRALHGVVDVLERDGVVVVRRHRHDNRLAMSVLTRLDALAASDSQQNEAPRLLAAEFGALVDSVCAGPAAAAEFIRSRCALPDEAYDEENIIRRTASSPERGGGPCGASAEHGGGADTNSEDGCEPTAPPNEPELTPREQARFAAIRRVNAAFDARFGTDEDDRPDSPTPADANDRRRLSRRERAAREAASRQPRTASERKEAERRRQAKERLDALSDEGLDQYMDRMMPELVEATGLQDEIDMTLFGIPPREGEVAAATAANGAGPPQHPSSDPSSEALAKEEALAKKEAPPQDEWQPSTSATLQSSPAVAGEGDRPQGGGGVLSAPPEDRREWVLGDDGIAVQLVNGKLPPHYHRRHRHQKFGWDA